MVRRTSFAALLAVFTFAAIAALPAAHPSANSQSAAAAGAGVAASPQGPIRLARHPDYHGGRIAFSYLGDIWTASENGSARPANHGQLRAGRLSAILARWAVDRLFVEPLRRL